MKLLGVSATKMNELESARRQFQ